MIRLVEWAIANALTVAGLAPFVYLLGRLSRQPAVRHGLWILLLVKLVTPPLIPVDVPLASPVSWSPSVEAAGVPIVTERRSEAPVFEIIQPSVPTLPLSGTTQSRAVPKAVVAATPARPERVPPSAPASAPVRPASSFWQTVIRAFLAVWLIGSASLLLIQFTRLGLFSKRLKRASYRCEALQEDQERVLAGLGRTSAPPTLMVNGVVSPMLWGVGPWCRILFPADLHRQLRPDARRTLLLHELAHYYRGDHLVRVLEFLTTSLFWWHPAVWWAIREIESSEEECCDNWVMRRTASSPRCYAEALLDTIDFLCERNPLAPPVASGLGNPRELRGRLVRIMRGGTQQTINSVGRVLLALVLVGLPLQPQALAALNGSIREALTIETEAPPPALISRTSTASLPSANIPSGMSPAPAIMTRAEAAPSARPRYRAWARAVSEDDRFEILARTGRRIELIDRETSRSTSLTDWNVAAVAFLPHRRQFVSAGFDRQVRLWDAVTGQIVENFDECTDAALTVAASPEGSRIGIGSRSGEVAVYEADDLARAAEWKFDSPISCVRFSPAGDRLLVATGAWRSESGELIVIDLETAEIVQRMHLDKPAGVADFTADPDVITTAAWNGQVGFVRLSDGERLAGSTVSKDLVSAGAFSADTRVFPALSLAQARSEEVGQLWKRQSTSAASLILKALAPSPETPSIGDTR